MTSRMIALLLVVLIAAGCGGRRRRKIVNIARNTELYQTLRVHDGPICSIQFSPDGQHLVTASRDGKINVIEWQSRKLHKQLEGQTLTAYPAVFDPTGERLYVGGKTAKVYNVEDWSEAGSFSGHSWIYDFAFSPDKSLVATAGGNDLSVRVWSTKDFKRVKRLKPHEKKIFGVTFDHRGGNLITGGLDAKVKSFRTTEGYKESATATVHSGAIMSLTSSPSSAYVVSTSATGEVLLLEARSLKVRGKLRKHGDNATCATFTQDGRFLATGSWDNNIYLYDLERQDRQPVRRYRNLGGKVNGVAIHPSGEWILAGSEDGTIRIWRLIEN